MMKLAKATEHAIKTIRQLHVPKTNLDLLQVPTSSNCAPSRLPNTSIYGNISHGYASKFGVAYSN